MSPKSGAGIATKPVVVRGSAKAGRAKVVTEDVAATFTSDEAARVLVKHLFASNDLTIPGLSYSTLYKLAQGNTGGDIIDLYHYDNDEVAVSIADIAGKGPQAAIHGALIKYGLRAYSSAGMTPERVMRAMDRLYLENSAFERVESFASVFFGSIDPTRRLMHYSSAGHEPVVHFTSEGNVTVLEPTAPLIGVFDDQHHLFRQAYIELPPESLLLGATDGVTEARDANGTLFGMDRLIDTVRKHQGEPESDIVKALLAAVESFCKGKRRDDIAIVALRVH